MHKCIFKKYSTDISIGVIINETLNIFIIFYDFYIWFLFLFLFLFLSLSGEWFLTDQCINQLDWMNSIKLGDFIGSSVGTVVWIVMLFNIR